MTAESDITIERGGIHDPITATITFPDGSTKTLERSRRTATAILDDVEVFLTAYNENTPETLDELVSTNREDRADLATDALNAYSGCLHSEYWELDNEVIAHLSVTSTEDLTDIEFMCGLTYRGATIATTREYGLHLRAHWTVDKYAIDYSAFDRFDPDEYVQRYADKKIFDFQWIEGEVVKAEEAAGKSRVVVDDRVSTHPRIAGTSENVFHTAWLVHEKDSNPATGREGVFGGLTEEDVELSLKYAHDHPDGYEAYVEEQEEQRNDLNKIIDEIEEP